MKVNVQYAREHFDELLTAMENGEDVELLREGKEPAQLQLVPRKPQTPSAPEAEEEWIAPKFGLGRTVRPFGFARDLISFAPDWDSAETNAEIAAEFENGEIFPAGHDR